MPSSEDDNFQGILADEPGHVDLTLGRALWENRDGQYWGEKDYRVKGEVWRVHKSDADPYPSNPHAHCIGGADRFVGKKLHLGTRELFDGRRPLDRYLAKKQFARLIELIKPKFPGIELPIPVPPPGNDAPRTK